MGAMIHIRNGELAMDENSKGLIDNMGLTCNYLITPGGTCCAVCGVLGKHYLVDKQPLLYWYDLKWMCEPCIIEAENE